MNDYVATAAAEKRLREILTARLSEYDISDLRDEDARTAIVDNLAHILLTETQIEYKPRLKAVLVTIPLPELVPSPEAVTNDAINALNSKPTIAETVASMPTPAGDASDPHPFAESQSGDCMCGEAKLHLVHVWPERFGTFVPKPDNGSYVD